MKDRPGGAKPPDGSYALLDDFAVQGEIEAVALDFVGDAQADRPCR